MKILGVCGGNGVILYPLKKYLIGNIEIRSNFKTKGDKQWKINFGNIPLITFKSFIPKNAGTCDVIIGAPNCGHSSVLAYSRAKKLSNPKYDESFNLYINSIKGYKPKIFLMENLQKSLEMFSEKDWAKALPKYELIFHVGSVSNWGNSQKTRKRLVIIGIRRKAFVNNLEEVLDHFNDIYAVNRLEHSGKLIHKCKGLSGHIREPLTDVITLYAGYKATLKTIKEYWDSNPTLKRVKVSDRKFTTAPGVYRNLKNDYPATARKSNRQFSHKGLQMSPRELARIQGVPDTFELSEEGPLTYKINKGRTTVTKTPPYEIGLWFSKQLLKIEEL